MLNRSELGSSMGVPAGWRGVLVLDDDHGVSSIPTGFMILLSGLESCTERVRRGMRIHEYTLG